MVLVLRHLDFRIALVDMIDADCVCMCVLSILIKPNFKPLRDVLFISIFLKKCRFYFSVC